MISFAEAMALVHENRADFGTESVPLNEATNRILATSLRADRDFPPFDRVMMDGLALRAASVASGQRAFFIEGVQAAGMPACTLTDPLACIEVMTGAVLPEGCDAVVPYEDCLLADGRAMLQIGNVSEGQNVHRRASDEVAGQVLVAAGTRVTPAIIGIAATVGQSVINVLRMPRVAICSTGDELVPITEQPAAHQIRRSNASMLASALSAHSILPTIEHLPDDPAAMQIRLLRLMERHDVLLFSGAVSKGKFDYLPQVLAELGMCTIFHRVAQKPGKPLLFGKFEGGQTVFGLPGNPVSTLVCFQLFFDAWLNASLQQETPILTAVLGADFSFRPALTYHLPVSIALEAGRLVAYPNAGNTSGDMVSLVAAKAVISLPPDKQNFEHGAVYPLTWLHPAFV